METKLKAEFEWYKAHQAELVEKYNGKTLVIVGSEVVGVYDSDDQAYAEAQKRYPLGTFLMHKCGPGEDNYTIRIYTPRFSAA